MPSGELVGEARLLREDVAALTKVVGALSRRVGVSRRFIIGLLASFVLDLFLTIGLVYTQLQGVAYVHCQAHYNEINNQRTRILTESADRERAANRAVTNANGALWLAPALSKNASERTPEEQAQLLKLFTDYQNALVDQRAAVAEADKIRNENPVPPPPSKTCG